MGTHWHPENCPENQPQFFKIILADYKELGFLQRIPKGFISKHGESLPDCVFLKVPSGAVWPVELMKYPNGEVWLHKGWQEFAEHHSIACNHFLVFRYEGNSHFHVLIFDTSASEVEYPFGITHNNETSNHNAKFQIGMEDIENDNHAESGEDLRKCQTRKEKISTSFLQPCKKTRTNGIFEQSNLTRGIGVPNMKGTAKGASHGTQANIMKRVKSEDDSSYCSMQEIRLLTGRGSEWKATTQRCSLSNILPGHSKKRLYTDGKARALESAKALKCKNPNFMVVIQPSYVAGRNGLNIPLNFVKRHFTKKHDNVILQTSNGRTWSCKFSTYQVNAKLRSWRKFACDNHLAVGDVCVFELINSCQNLLNVAVIRA